MGEDPRDIVALLVFWEFGLDSRYVATDMDITTNGTMGFLLLKLDANVNNKDYQAPGHACSSE